LKKIALLGLVALLFSGLIAGLMGCSEKKEAVELNVSAAASLTDVLKEVNDLYTEKHPNVTITANFASSGTLQTQIQQGAPCDVFISAGAKQMGTLQNGGLILDDTRKDLLNNKVVLIVPNGSTLGLADFAGLTGANVSRIAIGDPASVPAGTYGKKALDQLGIYSHVQSKLILCADVRAVLTYVENGDVDAGIVYSTDALISDKVKVVAEGPAEVNATIVYPVAVIKASENPDAAQKYVDFLSSNQAKAVFEDYGFVMVEA
jgi:molybdate transport system substrate-binding protein